MQGWVAQRPSQFVPTNATPPPPLRSHTPNCLPVASQLPPKSTQSRLRLSPSCYLPDQRQLADTGHLSKASSCIIMSNPRELPMKRSPKIEK